MFINIEDLTMREYEELLQGRGNHGLDIKTIEAMTMTEYEEMLQGRYSPGQDRLLPQVKDSPGQVRLSIEEMTMNEYLEMLRRDGEQQMESTHSYLEESCKFLNLIPCDFTDNSTEDVQELIDEACFNALMEDEDDFSLSTTQMEKILSSLEAFNSDQDLKDFDMLLDESATFWIEDDTNTSAISSLKQPFPFIDVSSRVDTFYTLYDMINNFCVYYFSPKLAYGIYRATRRWHAASVKRRKTLVKSNDELFIDKFKFVD